MARSLRSELAWAALLADAMDEAARRFCEKCETLSFQDDPFHLYVTRKTSEPLFTGGPPAVSAWIPAPWD